jgi:hypothetical protein
MPMLRVSPVKNGFVLSSKLALCFCDGFGETLAVELLIVFSGADVVLSCRSYDPNAFLILAGAAEAARCRSCAAP